jgi:LysR family transcriptional regulator, regulator of abg operon
MNVFEKMVCSFRVFQLVITMRLAQIEAFLAVAEAGSIRAAARGIGVSQPAMTKSIRALEADLGVVLFRRSAHGIELTGSGHMFLVRAKIISKEIERTRHEFTHAGITKTVTVSSAPGISALVLPYALSKLRQQAPEIEVRIQEAMPHASLPRLRDGSVDFAMGPVLQTPVAADLVATPLAQVEIAIVVRRGHPLAKARSLKSLVDQDWVTAGQGRDSIVVDEMFRAAGLFPPRWAVRCESIPGLIAIVAGTNFIATMPKLLLNLGFGINLVEPIAIRERLAVSNVCLFTKRDSPLTPSAARLVKLIKDAARRAT